MDNKGTIVVDSRQQIGKHDTKHRQLVQLGYKLLISKLPLGDYALINNMSVIVDTKKNVLELFMDLGVDHVRFRNECLLAQENGIQLIILTEEVLPRGGLANWKSPTWKSTTDKHKKNDLVTKENPEAKRKAMITMQDKYGVKFLFCNPSKTGSKIVELLLGGK